MKNKKIIDKLLQACITNKPGSFFPYLYRCKNVRTRFPSKLGYFKYLCEKLNRELCEGEYKAVGKIHVEVEPSPLISTRVNEKAYYFYDEVHTFPRMYVLIQEQGNNIILDLFPF